MSLSPLVKWSGGKSDELHNILPHIPEFDTYLEPFVGGGALYFHLNPTKAVINDIHPDLIHLYSAVGAGHSPQIKQFMIDHPNTEETYYQVRDEEKNETDLQKACIFYYMRKTCFRGMLRYNKQGKFNIPYGRYKTMNFTDLDNAEYETLLSRTTILNGSFVDIFKNYN